MFTSGVVPAAVGFFTIGAIALKDDDLEGEMSAIESWMRRCVGSRRECRYRGNGGWIQDECERLRWLLAKTLLVGYGVRRNLPQAKRLGLSLLRIHAVIFAIM